MIRLVGEAGRLARSRAAVSRPMALPSAIVVTLAGLLGLAIFLPGCARLAATPLAGSPAVGAPTVSTAPTAQSTPSTADRVSPIGTPSPTSLRWDGVDWTAQTQALVGARSDDLTRLDSPTLYSIEMEIFPEKSSLIGQMKVRYTNQESLPLDELVFRLFANDEDRGGSLDIVAVTIDGQSAKPSYFAEGTAMRLPFATPLPVHASVEVLIDFHVTVPTSPSEGYREFVNREGIMTLAGFYPLIPAFDGDGWSVDVAPSYGDVVYADSALYRVEVTLPRSLIAVATGVLSQQAVDYERQTKSLLFVSGPAREFNLAISPDFQSRSQRVGETDVRVYFKPAGRTAAGRVLRVAAESLGVFNELFGIYPYVELDLVETPTRAGGIEYPGLIVLNQDFFKGELSERMDWVVVHEVAHQWWYGVVGSDQVNEPWLDEALTNYSTWLYFERTVGEPLASQLLEQVFREPAAKAKASGQDMPIDLPVQRYTPENYSPIVYGKGSLFFHALREQVGSETFLTILRTYLEQYLHKNARGADFLLLAEEVSGQDLDDLYRTWDLPAPE
jgi:hypothetical protein